MITAVSAPEPPEEPKPKTESEIIAAYKVDRKETLESVANVVNAAVSKTVTDVATAIASKAEPLVTYERPLTDEEVTELGMERGPSFADQVMAAMAKDPDIVYTGSMSDYLDFMSGKPLPLDFDEAFANFRKDTQYISATYENRLNLERLGIDPESDDDTIFGARQLYCGAHCRVHGSGWCTVRLVQKRPLKAEDRADAIAEATALGLLSEDDK